MKLFEIDENREIQLNKPWIFLTPEFKALLDRDKGSKGDYRGDKKLRAIKEFTFIYFLEDFSSSIRDWEPAEKRREALYYAGLAETDIDDKVEAARAKYAELMVKASRSLRTLRNLWKGLDAMDTQFAKDDLFTKTDKMGKSLYTVSDFANDTIKINKVYDSIRDFEKRVEDDMKQAGTGIRGPNSVLGDNEGKKRTWSESDIAQGSAHSGGPQSTATFNTMLTTIRETEKQSRIKLKEKPKNLTDIFNIGEGEEEEDD